MTDLHDPIEYDQPQEILPGIFWLRLRLPFALDHVNLWLVDGQDGWTLIDGGLGDRHTSDVFDALWPRWFAHRPLRRIIVTHFHPDHLGQASRLLGLCDAELVMTPMEWLTGRMLALDDSELFRDSGEVYDRRAGLDEDLIRTRRERGNLYRRNVYLPPASFSPVIAGDCLSIGGETWQVITAQGHSPDMITLFCADRRVLICADQLLPKITPVVGIWPSTTDRDPLESFVRALDHFSELPADTIVLPSHRVPYSGLHARRRDLRAHHEERLAETLRLCAGEPKTTIEVAHHLFARAAREPAQTGFVIAETLAHLRALEHRGELVLDRRPGEPDRWHKISW